MTTNDTSFEHWPLAKRIGFRFLASYFLYYTIPFPLDAVPVLGGFVESGFEYVWKTAGTAVAAALGIEDMSTEFTGSGDTTYDYVCQLVIITLALVTTLAWSLLDRRRSSYTALSRWLVVACRFYLGAVLLTYGISKVIPIQFPTPSIARLLQPWGDFSPMGVVWSFMGSSPAYTIFAGAGEVLAGLLLFFARTRLLGALVAIGVLANVVMINFAYDVPVKLYSSHLLGMALFLTLPDARRLATFLLGDVAVPPPHRGLRFASRRGNLAVTGLGLLLIAAVTMQIGAESLRYYRLMGPHRYKPDIWGIHEVETFTLGGETLPPLLTDETRWRALIVDHPMPMRFDDENEWPGDIGIQGMDGSIVSHKIVLDEAASSITVIPKGHMSLEGARDADVAIDSELHYTQPEAGRLVITGTWNGAPVEVDLKTRDLDSFELTGRGFHWINEFPRNR